MKTHIKHTLPLFSFQETSHFISTVPMSVLCLCDELLFNIISQPILFISQGSQGGRSFLDVCVHLNGEDEMTMLRWLARSPPGPLTTQTGNEQKGFYYTKPLKPRYMHSHSDSEGPWLCARDLCIYLQNLINTR